MIGKLYLKGNRKKRIEGGHPWIFRGEIERVEASRGDDVAIYDPKGHLLGVGYYNPTSLISGRFWGRKANLQVGIPFFVDRIQNALQLRKQLFAGSTSYRLVHGESDGLAGLIVDRFDDLLVVEVLTLGVYEHLTEIVAALIDVVQPTAIYERSDASVREKEGLTKTTGFLYGQGATERFIEEENLWYKVDVSSGQKTGHFYDQRLNRKAIGAYVQGKKVLDAFCHTGGFAMNAAFYGAKSVVAVDISAQAIATAQENAKRNALDITFLEKNAFDDLKERQSHGETFDVIILDPPAFAKGKSALEGAYRGYKEINLRAMKMLTPGGYLITSSCSYHMVEELFVEMLREAAADVGRTFQLVEMRYQSPDHPSLLGAPETRYLKCAILRLMEGE